jgi:sterol 3beta-glucosyltransferase
MKIAILTLGTRGDVQPYVALGLGLQRAGHTVVLATDQGFASFVESYGLEFAAFDIGFVALMQSAQGKAAMAGKGRLKLLQQVMPQLRKMMDDAWQAAQGADVIIFHGKVVGSPHIAEKLGVPAFLAMAMPAYSPTRAFATPVIGGGNFGGALNKLSYNLFLKAATLPYRGLIKRFRTETLGMPPLNGDDMLLRGKPIPKLYGYSAHVVPVPVDWDQTSHVTGYWFLPAQSNWQPPRELLYFLGQGAPPVYVGFGSMASEDSERVTGIVVDAVMQSGQRAILASGWGGLRQANASPNIFHMDSAPHDWLFPRCAAVVHHGGAGTTAAGLQAGKPTLICPFLGDQPFWGRRVHELGVGPKPIPQKKLSAAALAQAMRLVATDTGMAQRAQTLGTKIAAEDGVARAIEIIAAIKKS